MPSLYDQITDTLARLRVARRYAHPDRPASTRRAAMLEDMLNQLLDQVPRPPRPANRRQ